MKNSVVCNFLSWTKSIIDEGPLSLINFFYWLGSRWGLVIFCIPSLFCSCLLAPLVYPYMLWANLKAPFLSSYIYIYICVFTYQKTKKPIINPKPRIFHVGSSPLSLFLLGEFAATSSWASYVLSELSYYVVCIPTLLCVWWRVAKSLQISFFLTLDAITPYIVEERPSTNLND